MERQPKHRSESNVPVETSIQTVGRFIDFTKSALSDEPHAVDVEWEHQMNMLIGNEELVRVTNNPAYKGVPRIKEDLLFAYEHGGLSLLKAVFLTKTIDHTSVQEMGSAVTRAVEKILEFE